MLGSDQQILLILAGLGLLEEISGNSDAWWRSAAAGLDRRTSPQSGMDGAAKASRMIGELHWRYRSWATK